MPEPLAACSALLRERIWNTFPVAQPAFAKLLSLLEIEASRETATASITLGARSRMRINPDFVAAHCADDQSLVMLVLHELHHVVLGHTRLWDRSTPAMNIAFDAVINAQLCQLFPGSEWTKLFRGSYDPHELPWALLRPPENWGTPIPTWLPGSLGTLHRRLYTDTSVSYEELFHLLAETLKSGSGTTSADEEGAGGMMAKLLGDHAPTDDDGSGEAPDPDLLAEIRNIIAEWPMVELRSGRDQGGHAHAFRLDLGGRRREAARILRQAMRHLGDVMDGGMGRPRAVTAPTALVLPHRVQSDRRAAVAEACGGEALLFTGRGERRTIRRGELVHLYLDVSGSMDGVIAPLYAALSNLAPWMSPKLHLFSTVVEDVSHGDLRAGVGTTTGGTDISAVTGHMVRGGIRRALIVTDGWVGKVPSEHARELARRKSRFGVALTNGGDASFAKELPGARVWNLPDLSMESR